MEWYLGHLLLSQARYQETEPEVEQTGLELALIWDASITGNGLTS